jgi:hypothetical protein
VHSEERINSCLRYLIPGTWIRPSARDAANALWWKLWVLPAMVLISPNGSQIQTRDFERQACETAGSTGTPPAGGSRARSCDCNGGELAAGLPVKFVHGQLRSEAPVAASEAGGSCCLVRLLPVSVGFRWLCVRPRGLLAWERPARAYKHRAPPAYALAPSI